MRCMQFKSGYFCDDEEMSLGLGKRRAFKEFAGGAFAERAFVRRNGGGTFVAACSSGAEPEPNPNQSQI